MSTGKVSDIGLNATKALREKLQKQDDREKIAHTLTMLFEDLNWKNNVEQISYVPELENMKIIFCGGKTIYVAVGSDSPTECIKDIMKNIPN